ncbi:MAG: hypothetical protein CM1200mP30_28260 [Pseudomonadota bacterium]|nr:MAG: hypothetical protein CM1200mP30_28260 [Pseudomonadota bacterium]
MRFRGEAVVALVGDRESVESVSEEGLEFYLENPLNQSVVWVMLLPEIWILFNPSFRQHLFQRLCEKM